MLIVAVVERDLMMTVARGAANDNQLGQFREIARVESRKPWIKTQIQEYMKGPPDVVKMANRLQRAVHRAGQEMPSLDARRGAAGSQTAIPSRDMPVDQSEETRGVSLGGGDAFSAARGGSPARGSQRGGDAPNAGRGGSPARGSQRGSDAPNPGRGGTATLAYSRGGSSSPNSGRGGTAPLAYLREASSSPSSGRGGTATLAYPREGSSSPNSGRGGTALLAYSREGSSSPNSGRGESAAAAAAANRREGGAMSTAEGAGTLMGLLRRPSSQRLLPSGDLVAGMMGGIANLGLSPRTSDGSGRRGATGAPDAAAAAAGASSSTPGAAPGSQLAPADRPNPRKSMPDDSKTGSPRGRR
jgi:hypothetical protein